MVTIRKVLPCSIHSMSSRLICKAQLLIKARAEDIRETVVQHRVDVEGIMMVMLGGGVIIAVVDVVVAVEVVVVVEEHTTG